ncbi:MAG: AAA family ATPase [Nitrosopumilaceae archaeon]
MHQLWVEKYRPKSIAEYIFYTTTHKEQFKKMIQEKWIPHLLLYGSPGVGKTTLARVLINELALDPTDTLTINASDENNIETIRTKIISFVSTYANGPFKVVFLDEADYISQPGQGVLRKVLEDFSDSARFILAGNYAHKFIPAVRSRCQEFTFKALDKEKILEYVVDMLDAEKIRFDLAVLKKYVDVAYPDIRKTVNLLQQNSINGVLVDVAGQTGASDYKFQLLDLLEQDKWIEIRKLVCENVTGEEWEDMYRFLYDNLKNTKKFKEQSKWDAGTCIIAEYLYKHGLCADSEINFAACIIRLGQI